MANRIALRSVTRRASRSFATSSLCRAGPSSSSAAATGGEEGGADEGKATSSSRREALDWHSWLNGEGARFRDPTPGRPNWIGDTPFPLNPAFDPLPPLSDTIKTRIYNAFVHNIKLDAVESDSQVVRAIAHKYGVSKARVKAIIRLKEQEEHWKAEGRPLESKLSKGMEGFLGVKQPSENWKGLESAEGVSEQSSSGVKARRKPVYEFLDVENGDRSVFLPLLARLPPKSSPSSTSSSSSSSKPTPSSSSSSSIVPPPRAGRPSTLFVDLSGTAEGKKLEETYDPLKTKRGNRKKVVATGGAATGGARQLKQQQQQQQHEVEVASPSAAV